MGLFGYFLLSVSSMSLIAGRSHAASKGAQAQDKKKAAPKPVAKKTGAQKAAQETAESGSARPSSAGGSGGQAPSGAASSISKASHLHCSVMCNPSPASQGVSVRRTDSGSPSQLCCPLGLEA